jgi:hypothetical protein
MNSKSWIAIACIALFLHGCYCFANSRWIQQQAEQLPEMTCDQLLQNGLGRGNCLKLTGVRLCTAGHAFDIDMDAASKVVIPIYSARLAREPRPSELQLLLEILDDRDWDRLQATPEPMEFACEIWTRAEKIDLRANRSLEAKYPGIQVRKCRVVTIGLHEPTLIKASRSWWFGIESFLLTGSLFSWLVWLRPASLVDEGTVNQPHSQAFQSSPAGGVEFYACLERSNFHEVQRPNWSRHVVRSLWLVIVPGVLGSSVLVDSLASELPVLLIPLSVVCLWGALFGLLWGYFYFIRMETLVTKSGMVVGLSFSEGASISHAEIETAQVVPYNPDTVGGWFVVRSRGRAVFWVAGGQSVELTLRDGRKVQIGTQRPRELLSALRACTESVSSSPQSLDGTNTV